MPSRIRRAVDAVGLGGPARKVRDTFAKSKHAGEHPTDIRNRLDDEHLALLLAFALRSDSNCIDVGAHEGLFLGDILRAAPRGRHIAYEPIPHMFASLVARFPTIDLRQRALSNAPGTSTFTHVVDLPGYSGLRDRTYPREVTKETITVITERLDDSLPENWKLDFLKIDVEGAEALVFEGAMDTIRRDRPIIAFEHGPGAAEHYGTRPGDIYTLLVRDAGLLLFDMDGNGPYELRRFEEAFASGFQWNWVARP